MNRQIRLVTKQGAIVNNNVYQNWPIERKIVKTYNCSEQECLLSNCMEHQKNININSQGDQKAKIQAINKIINRNILIHKVTTKPNIKIETKNKYISKPPIYQNIVSPVVNQSPHQIINTMHFAVPSKAPLMQPHVLYGTVPLKKKVNQRFILKQIRPSSPDHFYGRYSKPKITIRYMSPPQIRATSFSPPNQRSIITSLNSKKQIKQIEVGPKIPNILRRINKTSRSRQKKFIEQSIPTGLKTHQSGKCNNYYPEKLNTYKINIIGAHMLKSQSYGPQKQYSLKSTQWTAELPNDVENVEKNMRGQQSIVEMSMSKQFIEKKKQIFLNCDKFSEHSISDRSISDDIQL